MTPRLIKKARAMMGQSESHWTIGSLVAALISPKPHYADNDIEGILYTLNDISLSTSSNSFPLPAPKANMQGVWKIKNMNPKDATGTICYVSDEGELALVPEKEIPDSALADKIFTQDRENCRKQYMGNGDGYDWYANLPDALANELISRFYLHRDDIKRHVLEVHLNSIIYLLPDALLNKYKARWLSENLEEKVDEIPGHLHLINSPESKALLHEGLKPSSTYFFRNFKAAKDIDGIFESYYKNLNFDQRIDLVSIPTFGIGYKNFRIPPKKMKLLEPYTVDEIMSALSSRLGNDMRKNPEWQSLEIHLWLRPGRPENDPKNMSFEKKIDMTMMRCMLHFELAMENESCRYSFLRGETYDKVIIALRDYPATKREEETLKTMINYITEHPESLEMDCDVPAL